MRLLRVEPGGALLLDRVEPGTPLADAGLADDEATRRVAEALLLLHVAVPDGLALPTVAEECAGLTGDGGAVLHDLLADARQPVVLHGDLHGRNLLRGPTGWVAVDPHGVVGDAGYDVGPWLVDAGPADVRRQAARRVAVLAEVLVQDRARVAAWGFVRARLSALWARVDGTPPLPHLRELAAALRP